MVDPLSLRIFLASPGDVSDERAAISACVEEHARRRSHVNNVAFELVEWSRVRGTTQRSQEAINELIAESHFMIVVFKGSWGSESGSPWAFTSGTEEELFTALLELGQPEQPMRDVWLAFVDADSRDYRVTNLRQQIIDRHALLFETIKDTTDLKAKLTQRLESWEGFAGAKNPRHIDLLPSSGKDLLRAANLRLKGEKLVSLGQSESGGRALMEAAVLGGPVEQLAYARYLRRVGKLDDALALIQRAIEHLVRWGALFSTPVADAFSAEARVLSAQGKQDAAIGRLEHALTLVRSDDGEAVAARCRLLDDLGLARQMIGDLSGARQSFETSLLERQKAGPVDDVCQSRVNLARLELAENELELAATHAEQVIEALRETAPSGLHANAEVLLAQVRLGQGRPVEAVPHAERALALNRQLSNRRGEAISLFVLSECCKQSGRDGDAKLHAQACLDVNEAMGDDKGAAKARGLLDGLLPT